MSAGYDGWQNDYFDPEYDEDDCWEHAGRCPACGIDELDATTATYETGRCRTRVLYRTYTAAAARLHARHALPAELRGLPVSTVVRQPVPAALGPVAPVRSQLPGRQDARAQGRVGRGQ